MIGATLWSLLLFLVMHMVPALWRLVLTVVWNAFSCLERLLKSINLQPTALFFWVQTIWPVLEEVFFRRSSIWYSSGVAFILFFFSARWIFSSYITSILMGFFFCLSRCYVQASLHPLQSRLNRGLLLWRIVILWLLQKQGQGKHWAIWSLGSFILSDYRMILRWVQECWFCHQQGSWQHRYMMKQRSLADHLEFHLWFVPSIPVDYLCPQLIDIHNIFCQPSLRHSMFYTFQLPISCPILFSFYSSIKLNWVL